MDEAENASVEELIDSFQGIIGRINQRLNVANATPRDELTADMLEMCEWFAPPD